MTFRTDRNNNPTAFTTLVAEQGLVEGMDYEKGESFTVNGRTFYTAKLLGDPIEITIKLINKAGFYTVTGSHPRWDYISMPKFVWDGLLDEEKKKVIQFMYHREGGTELEKLFV